MVCLGPLLGKMRAKWFSANKSLAPMYCHAAHQAASVCCCPWMVPLPLGTALSGLYLPHVPGRLLHLLCEGRGASMHDLNQTTA